MSGAAHHLANLLYDGKTAAGAASLKIELRNGHITVYHGGLPGDVPLAYLHNAPEGSLGKLWDALEKLGFVRANVLP